MTLDLRPLLLVGRQRECERLASVVEQARNGRSASLLLLGDPGIGKTTLLEHAIREADAMTVVVARGVRSESELPYSGLAELLRPMLGRIDRLPPRQAGALASALAIGPATGADPFAVAAATLSLLAASASDRPLLIVVDDLHWIDSASAEALLFAVRRLGAEPVATILAARTGSSVDSDTLAIPVLRVGGLDREAALALLSASTPGPIAAQVIDRLVHDTEGNPLALMELPSVIRAEQLSGKEPLEDAPLPVSDRIERAYADRIASLPGATRTALLVVAASDAGSIGLLARALELLGIDMGALDAGEDAGLVTQHGTHLTFRHPLVCSAVYQAADASERRAAHAALAAAWADVPGDPDHRRAWHLAAASVGPDESVARALETAADAAARRSASASAAAALERAAELSPDRGAAAARLLGAACAWHLANRSDRAVVDLDVARSWTADPLLRAQIEHQRGRIDIWRGPARQAHVQLCAEAERVRPIAPERAAAMYADATSAGITAGALDRALVAARRGYRLAQRVGGSLELVAALQLGKVRLLMGDAARGYPLVMRSVEVLDIPDDDLALRSELVWCAPALMTAEAYELAERVLMAVISTEREANALGFLSYSLAALAELQARTGRWTESYANGTEATLLAREAGQAGQLSYNLARLARVEAARGLEPDCRAHVVEALDIAERTDFGSAPPFAESALGLLELGLGNLPAAIDHLEETGRLMRQFGILDPGRLEWEGDLVEAYSRSGRDREASAALRALEHKTSRFLRPVESGPPGGTPCLMASAIAARCRGMRASATEVDDVFAEAMAWHDRSDVPFERARTELCHGERLRRVGRRVDARAHLHAAMQSFERLDAEPWTRRAHTELLASGEAVGPRHPRELQRLTPQELQVALIVAKGATNKEAGAALFLTPKTIEFHLAKIYRKLDLRSRTELAAWGASNLVPLDRQAAAPELCRR